MKATLLCWKVPRLAQLTQPRRFDSQRRSNKNYPAVTEIALEHTALIEKQRPCFSRSAGHESASMEKSLDELTEFLLGEIATCGAKGEASFLIGFSHSKSSLIPSTELLDKALEVQSIGASDKFLLATLFHLNSRLRITDLYSYRYLALSALRFCEKFLPS